MYKSFCCFAMSVNLIKNPFKRKWLLMYMGLNMLVKNCRT